MKKVLVYGMLGLGLSITNFVEAHSGGLDSGGGHWNHKEGTYHQHRHPKTWAKKTNNPKPTYSKMTVPSNRSNEVRKPRTGKIVDIKFKSKEKSKPKLKPNPMKKVVANKVSVLTKENKELKDKNEVLEKRNKILEDKLKILQERYTSLKEQDIQLFIALAEKNRELKSKVKNLTKVEEKKVLKPKKKDKKLESLNNRKIDVLLKKPLYNEPEGFNSKVKSPLDR